MRKLTSSFAIIFILAAAIGCNSQPGIAPIKTGTSKVAVTEKKSTEAPVKWMSVNDMTENSFSIQMPEGWQNAALLHRKWSTPRSLVTAVSPDKNTVIYLGDPGLPVYTFPNSQMENQYRQLGMQSPFPSMKYRNAENYFSEYIQKRFGNLEGFRILEKFDNKPVLELLAKEIKKLTFKVDVTTVSYRFEYKSKGRTIHGLLNGSTVAVGEMWQPEVSGFCTAGDPGNADGMLIKMMQSRESNPQWQKDQEAKHQQTMAMIEHNTQQMTRQHEQRMANIRSSSAAHQQRMADMQQQHEQWNQSWQQNQASQEAQHEKFLNTIKGEHTVRDNEGNTYQVDNSQQKYYVDKTNNTYIGADGTTTIDDLRKIKGINIDNFEEVQIIR